MFFSSVYVELIEAFEIFDKDKDGTISIGELGSVLRAVGQNPSNAQLEEIMKKADKNGTSHPNQDRKNRKNIVCSRKDLFNSNLLCFLFLQGMGCLTNRNISI
jgi:hypothetical protein